MKKKHYVVIADAARARIVAADRRLEEFEERGDLAHWESLAQSREIRSDRPGKGQAYPGGPESGMEEDEVGRHEAEVFANQLADRLVHALDDPGYEQLILVAPPQFLGFLRDALEPRVKQKVTGSVDKDYTKLPLRDALDRIREALET